MAWPNPRFTDNGNGTITDNLTCLIWDKDANRFGVQNWPTALTSCNTLDETDNANLSDGSVEGDWRLPNIRELQSLVHYGVFAPALPNTAGTGKWSEGDPFYNVRNVVYWSSTTFAFETLSAWGVDFGLGIVHTDAKYGALYTVWCVRGGS